jgi:peptidyl-dipeptidase Dcp
MLTNCAKENSNPLLQEFNTLHKTAPFSKIKNEHYMPAFEEAFKQGKKEIQEIVDQKEEPTFENTIVAIDNAGELLGKVAGVFYNLLSAETNEELEKIAEKISPKFSQFNNEIFLNEGLFKRVDAIYKQIDDINLNQEQKTLLKKTYKSFLDNGATLNGKDKERFKKINERLSILSLNFSNNVRKETNKFMLEISDKKDLAGLPESAVEAAAMKAKSKKKEGWVVDLTYPSFGPFMKYADNRSLREKLYKAYMTKALHGDELDNRKNVEEIVSLRLEMAKLLGFQNYAEYVLEDRMAENSENVYNLLNNLKDSYKKAAFGDIKELQEFANKIGFKGKIQPWDFSYYSNKLKEEKYSLNDELLKPYFKLENVRKGAFDLATALYGITFKENKEIEVYHKDVTAYEVFDKDGKFLAVFYTDYFPREGKRGGAWMNNFFEQSRQNGKDIRPHVVNVMNFTMPTESKPSLLTFSEVTTLLHEFGHGLHGILANTTYEGLSGTNVDRDFVELPSQVMENFALEKEFLDKFAKHYKTGELIPQKLVDKIIASNNYMKGYGCYRQLSFGYLDMAWHTLEEMPKDLDVEKFEKEAWADVQLLPSIDGTSMSVAFGHIFAGGYAAGYYGYKWAEVLDADAFAVFKKHGIFNQKIARAFRTNILEKGGTENPMELYKKFKGAEPTIDALLARDGIKK